ncbi:uncharacterized protein LOC115970144 [Quercus lobata]|uniref:uncharacterized protein LOC115970144 n=1 Tax=Quercus lobata TaxID=97700 RepID=UPI00124822A1|nr:uncharacterized protein LOC115970144 [Quercus lobata]
MEFVKRSIKFDHLFVVEAKGRAGGLCILWKDGLSVKVVDFNKNLIAVKIFDSACEWLLVGFYGPPYPSKKKKARENLMALLEAHHGPWMCFGDFNFVLNENEILGGKKGSSSTNFLKDLMFEVGAIDLGYSGVKYTWAKDSAWNDEHGGSEFTRLCKKQAATRDALKKWNKEVFGKCQERINAIMKRIKEIQSQPPSFQYGDLEAALQAELSEWLLRSETLWRQKSRELWLKLGDKNSKFFHLSTIVRRKRNNIDAIRDGNGSWITEGNAIRKRFLDHFKDLF